ncbi:ABC transporter permease [Paraburkholderia sabiae]|uniref:Autoinducer 2 import system permease protein LsrC n=1 Tax=Paraburkholderia sabiae TaxID=273251 RepID=A0ABU9QKV3_9BURK|nr:ABC transporter permease [Paraburkholderia sabiae]WJZ76483.1 ABC transporter permease [Paraburkholderia sabiae]CAD6560195.1 L-arabinose transport system permease protein AraH [Paraburkholderia sabiae]
MKMVISSTPNASKTNQSQFRIWLRNEFSPNRVQATTVRLLCLIVFAGAGMVVPHFASTANLSSIVYSTAAIGTAAIGLAAVTLCGELFLLSTGATAAFAAIVFVSALGFGSVAACVAAVAVGLTIGFLQGLAVGLLRCNPIIASIAAASVITGVASLLTGGRTIIGEGDVSWLGLGVLFPGLPHQGLLLVVAALVLEIVMQRTRFGRELRLVGINRVAARIAGLRTRLTALVSCTLAGGTAAMAGVLVASQSGTANLLIGTDLTFSAIAAVLVGGIGIAGGRGRISDAAFGALFLAIIGNLLLVNNLPYEAQLAVKGAAVLISVAIGSVLSGKRR